jgi:hypothetical protein
MLAATIGTSSGTRFSHPHHLRTTIKLVFLKNLHGIHILNHSSGWDLSYRPWKVLYLDIDHRTHAHRKNVMMTVFAFFPVLVSTIGAFVIIWYAVPFGWNSRLRETKQKHTQLQQTYTHFPLQYSHHSSLKPYSPPSVCPFDLRSPPESVSSARLS